MEETKEDQSTFYGNIGLNWSMFGIYGAGLIGCVGLGFVSWFERTGRAGPHRTLINRLVSFNLDQVQEKLFQ